MTRLDTKQLIAKAMQLHGGEADPSGAADLIAERGSIVAAGDPAEFKPAFKRLKKIPGYRWIVINREDLFAANTLSIGSKAGILDSDGAILKAADIPRKKL